MHRLAWLAALAVADAASRPNLVMIVVDDLGYNDVSMHGSPQIPTPGMDGLCAAGTRLNRYYVQPVCSPTRATIMTGRHVINTGVYNPFSEGPSMQYLDLQYALLPSHLKTLGYDTHMVGKWHLGSSLNATLPVARGFDSHVGYLQGAEDYYHHCLNFKSVDISCSGLAEGGYDFIHGETTASEYNGTYSAEIFARQALRIVRNYSNPTADGAGAKPPFFLYLAFQNVHAPMQVPAAYEAKFPSVPNPAGAPRRTFCGMVDIVDEAIANVTAAIREGGLEESTLVVLTSDNGGPADGYDGNAASNYPLRGGKNAIWEGGTRVVGCAKGPGVPAGKVWDGLMHASDWMHTLLEAVGGAHLLKVDDVPFQLGDGMSVWPALSTTSASPRTWILYEAHDPDLGHLIHGNAILVGDMKLAQVRLSFYDWPVPPGQDPAAINYSVQCGGPPPASPPRCKGSWCLFNVTADPCEHTDLSAQHPEIVAALKAELAPYQKQARPVVPNRGCLPSMDKFGAWERCA